MSLLVTIEGRPARDYSLTGPEAVRADERGLVDGAWFRSPIEPERLRALSERSNGRAMFDVVLWLALIVGTGAAAVSLIGSWWSVMFFGVYGALYGGASDARWHEFGHGTGARSRWVNDAVYVLASFMLLRCPTAWRWSHFRHHSDTIVVGRDPEIQIGRPGSIRRLVFNFLYVFNGARALAALVRYASGRLDAETKSYVPVDEQPKVVAESRIFVGVLLVAVAASLLTSSWVPLLLIGLPTFYGAWLMVFFGSVQHLGLREDVLDHRESTRTVLMNPVFRFLYLNMNYHVEHHMFPSVPYYRLPALHSEIRNSLPAPTRSMLHAYGEVLSSLWRQRRDADDVVPNRVVPSVAAVDTDRLGTVRPDGRLDLGDSASFAVGTLARVDVADRTFAVARLDDGRVCVVDGMCTHGNAHLADGTVHGTQIECPKHRGRFDLVSGVACAKPATAEIATHSVDVVDGHFILQEPTS